MVLRRQGAKLPIRLAVEVTDPALRARIVVACRDLDSIIAEDVAEDEEAAGDADIVLADRPPATALPVIALASNALRENPTALREAWPSDVRAIVPGDLDAATLAAVVAVVAAGFTVMPRDKAGAWAESADVDLLGEDAFGEPPAALTPREREVLTLLTEGASNKAIARALGVSVHTAKFHVASLADKLGAKGRVEAVAIAIRSGLVIL
jgi:DNA-binding NarL/FixJ family response regulator